MKTKLILTCTTMALSTMLLLTALAKPVPRTGSASPRTASTKSQMIQGQKIDLGTRIELPCQGEAGGDVASTVRVTNNTADEIPALTRIYVQTDNGKAHEALSVPLARRRTAIIHAPKGGQPRSCQAWFFKQ